MESLSNVRQRAWPGGNRTLLNGIESASLHASRVVKLLTETRRHRLIWTVEWIHVNRRREIGICPESDTLSAAYAAHLQTTTLKDDPDQGENLPRKKKRKHGVRGTTGILAISPSATEDAPIQDIAVSGADAIASPKSYNGASRDILKTSLHDIHPDTQDVAPLNQPATLPKDIDPRDGATDSLSLSRRDNFQQQQDPFSEQPSDKAFEAVADQLPTQLLHFYLHAPRLPSPQPVLIPLRHDCTLSANLRNHLVLEFPTIYVLESPPSELPDDYITEEAFDKQMQQESFRDSVMAKLTGNEEGEIDQGVDQEDNVDAKKLEEVLKRDLKCI